MTREQRKPGMPTEAFVQKTYYFLAVVLGILTVIFIIMGFVREMVVEGIIAVTFTGICAGFSWWYARGFNPPRRRN